MVSPHKKAYKDSPKMERGEDGKMKVGKKKSEEKHEEKHEGGHEGEMPKHVVHAMDRRDLHNRHEMEHMLHKGDKKKLHEKHHKEMQALHSKHEKELGGGGKEDGDTAAIENEAQPAAKE